MKSYVLLLPLILSFLITLFLTPYWIRKAHQIGLVWDDMNKIRAKKVAGSAGIAAVMAFIISVLIFVAYRTFDLRDSLYLVEILSLILVVSLLAGIGLIDDILGWQRGGLSRRSRILLIALSSIPLMVINAGKHSASVPFFGNVDFGLFYSLLIIPIGIVGATATYNFLAGFNGLEAGQGAILMFALAIVTYFTGNSWLSVIALCMAFSLLAFLIYNCNPANAFPGNSLTYSIGGLFAVISILGDFERVALFFFIPYIIETVLKSRGKLEKHSFGKPMPDGSLDLKYDKIYSLNHMSIYLMKRFNIKPTETKVVLSIWLFQIIIILIGFFIFRESIFLV